MFGAATHQGARQYMEDRHIIVENIFRGYSLYAIFDGHGGSDVADICKNNIVNVLKRNLATTNVLTDIREVLNNVFVDLSALIPPDKGYICGTTCLLVLKHTNHAWVANCGDSRGIMNYMDTVVELSTDHKPGTPAERSRIETLGGYVSAVDGVPRVSGELAVSRSLGDSRYHPYVVFTPEIRYFPFTSSNRFMVLATDGLWDVMSNMDVVRFVNQSLAYNPVENTAWMLMKHAYEVKNAEDNMTIVVVTIR
jgi:serine/threonine protein phosphatase PrpC